MKSLDVLRGIGTKTCHGPDADATHCMGQAVRFVTSGAEVGMQCLFPLNAPAWNFFIMALFAVAESMVIQPIWVELELISITVVPEHISMTLSIIHAQLSTKTVWLPSCWLSMNMHYIDRPVVCSRCSHGVAKDQLAIQASLTIYRYKDMLT